MIVDKNFNPEHKRHMNKEERQAYARQMAAIEEHKAVNDERLVEVSVKHFEDHVRRGREMLGLSGRCA